jgi:hypothetical protein
MKPQLTVEHMGQITSSCEPIATFTGKDAVKAFHRMNVPPEREQHTPGTEATVPGRGLAVLAGCRQVSGQLSAMRPLPVRIDRELDDGEELAFGGGAVMVPVLGHTPAAPGSLILGPRCYSLATRWPTVSTGRHARRVHTDRAQGAASCLRLAGLNTDIACFVHGEPPPAPAAEPRGRSQRKLLIAGLCSGAVIIPPRPRRPSAGSRQHDRPRSPQPGLDRRSSVRRPGSAIRKCRRPASGLRGGIHPGRDSGGSERCGCIIHANDAANLVPGHVGLAEVAHVVASPLPCGVLTAWATSWSIAMPFSACIITSAPVRDACCMARKISPSVA